MKSQINRGKSSFEKSKKVWEKVDRPNVAVDTIFERKRPSLRKNRFFEPNHNQNKKRLSKRSQINRGRWKSSFEKSKISEKKSIDQTSLSIKFSSENERIYEKNDFYGFGFWKVWFLNARFFFKFPFEFDIFKNRHFQKSTFSKI